MKFTKIPDAYSCYRNTLLYAFDTEAEAHDVEVEIVNADSGEVMGRKRLYGVSAGEIDISPYLQGKVRSTLPATVGGCGAIECNMQSSVKVVVDGVESDARCFIAANIDPSRTYTPLMNNILQRTMACDEFDVVSWFARPGAEVEVVVEAFGKGTESLTVRPSGVGQQAVAITALDFIDIPDTMRATVKVDGVAMTVVEYQIKPNLQGARRLAWLNEHLTPELYTFPLRKSVLIKAAREHIKSVLGEEATALERENELKLISAYEPQAQVKAFADILPAEKVWVVEGCTPQRVEIVVDRVFKFASAEMCMFEVNVHAAEEGVRLW